MEDGLADPNDPKRPQVMRDAFQVFECTWAKEKGVTLITDEHVKIINDKRTKEKKL